MKRTAANRNAATTRQARRARLNTGAGTAATRRKTSGQAKAPSASQRATEQARRGEPLTAENRGDRSPKQENL